MAMNAANARGYRSGLVDLATGQISREIFVNEDILRWGPGARFRALVAVRRPREPNPQSVRFLRLVHGRGVPDIAERDRGTGRQSFSPTHGLVT
jgi:hypothetical protein